MFTTPESNQLWESKWIEELKAKDSCQLKCQTGLTLQQYLKKIKNRMNKKVFKSSI